MQNERPKEMILKERAYVFALRIIQLIDGVDKKDMVLRTIAGQLLRSATSIGANVIEAQAGSSRRDFTNFFAHALKSANETRFWLGLLRDAKKLPSNAVQPLLDEATELANILGASVVTLRRHT